MTNQNYLFEGNFLSTTLFEIYSEWKDCDFVGVLSYSAFNKISKQHVIEKINVLNTGIYDVLFLNVANNDLLEGHSYACDSMRLVLHNLMKKVFPKLFRTKLTPISLESPNIGHYAFCNYFVARPSLMLEYIIFFRDTWLPMLENEPTVWNDAFYNGKSNHERLLELSSGKVSYYSYHTFINERILYPYFYNKGAYILI
jgi:hypothetical protein